MAEKTEELFKALDDAVRDAVAGKEIAVAFSGGLDSGIIAVMAGKYSENITLYTVGTETSHDLLAARDAANIMGMELKHIFIDEDKVMDGLRDIIRITGTKDPVTLSFELPLYLVCREYKGSEIIGGQGADELFAGYSKYVGLGEKELSIAVESDKRKLKEVTIPHETAVAGHFNKTIHYPFMDAKVIRVVEDAGIHAIMPSDPPNSRKRMLRDVADAMGCQYFSNKEKKAAQYGSGAMDIIKRICRSKGLTYRELIEMLERGDEDIRSKV